MTFQVFDMQGRTVNIEFIEFDEAVNATNIKLEAVPAGVYIIQTKKRSWKVLVL